MASLKTHHLIAYTAAAALALILGLWAGGITDNGQLPAPGLELEGGTSLAPDQRPLPRFELSDHNGSAFDNARLSGHWSLLFFGYTHCPDICPTTLVTMANAAKQIDALPGAAGKAQYQMIFVSVDPERDNLEHLKTYVTHFDPDFLGVTGPDDKIKTLTGPLGILHVKVPDPRDPENYLVDHNASILVVNPRGEWEAVLRAPHDAGTIARDFEAIVTHYPQG